MWLYRISNALLAACTVMTTSLAAEEACKLPDIPATPTRLVIRASPTLLPTGTRCRVALPAKPTGPWSTSSTSYEGEIIQTAADKLLLRATVLVGRSDSRPPLSLGLPFIDRYFRSTGLGMQPLEGKELWLRVEEIDSIEVLELPPRKGEGAAEAGI